jgi:hypothetical protein
MVSEDTIVVKDVGLATADSVGVGVSRENGGREELQLQSWVDVGAMALGV